MKKIFTIAMLGTLFVGGTLYARAVFDCNKCKGTGCVSEYKIVTCRSCHGNKNRICRGCNGKGSFGFGHLCGGCFGRGREICFDCADSGTKGQVVKTTCPQCKGKGRFSL